MPDLGNDSPTPDFDDLIAQARRLREEGRDDEAIAKYEEAKEVDSARPELCELMELYVEKKSSAVIDQAILLSFGATSRYNQVGNLSEAADTYHKVSESLLEAFRQLVAGEIIDNPGPGFAILSIFAKDINPTLRDNNRKFMED